MDMIGIDLDHSEISGKGKGKGMLFLVANIS
jgi:hypothetical protein